MKKKILILGLLVHSSCSFSQTSAWQWAKTATCPTSASLQEPEASATDNAGNTYATGFYYNPSQFGPYTLPYSGTSGDVFIVKYSSAGGVQWAKSFVGTSVDMGFALATDVSNNFFIAGMSNSNPLLVDTINLYNTSYNTFIAKYNSGGNVIWAKNPGGANDDVMMGLATDSLGNVYATGYSKSPSLAFDTVTLTTAGNYDMFIVKYDTNGNVIWAKSAGGANNDIGNSITVDGAGNVLMSGWFDSPSITLGSIVLTNTPGVDSTLFVAKYSPSGSVLWAKVLPNFYQQLGNGITTDSLDNVYVAAGYKGATPFYFANDTLIASGYSDAALLKFDLNGSQVWAVQAGGVNKDLGFSVITNSTGVYMTGSFSDTIKFDSYVYYYPYIFDAMFLVKYDFNGKILCAEALKSGGDDVCSLSADQSGNVYLAGDYIGHSFVVGTTTLTSLSNGETFFLLKYRCDNSLAGMDDQESMSDVFLYPNPSDGTFDLLVPESVKSGSFEIYDSMGKLIYQDFVVNQRKSIDMKNKPDGFYFMRVFSEGKILGTKKILKQ